MRKFLAGAIAIFLFGMFHIIEIYGKNFVDHFPPPEFMLRTTRFMQFPQFHIRAEYSYPSGHSGRTMFISAIIVIAVLSSKRFPKPVKAGIIAAVLGFDAVMLVSRIYLGEHWITDVIGGSILGLSLGLITTVAVQLDVKKLLKKSVNRN